MATFLLVHGAWHGAWCWTRLDPELSRFGHRVAAIDLPGGGDDPTPPSSVRLNHYAERIGEEIQGLAATEGAIYLVGHSTGGVAISCAAERWPDLVERCVYLSAIMIRSGQSLLGESLKHNTTSGLLQEGVLDVDEADGVVRYHGKDSDHILHNECGEEERAFARKKLRAEQPLGPWTTELMLTSSSYGTVPRTYVRTLRDRTVTLEFQNFMIEADPCDRVLDLDTDHSSFLSRPRELASILDQTTRTK